MIVTGGAVVFEGEDVAKLNIIAQVDPGFRNIWFDFKKEGAPTPPYQGGGYTFLLSRTMAFIKEMEDHFGVPLGFGSLKAGRSNLLESLEPRKLLG